MVLLVLAAAGGALVGRLRRPTGGHGARPHLRNWTLLAAGVALLLVAALLHGDASLLAYAGGLALVTGFAGSNLGVTGVAVVGLGVVLNLAGAVLNNGVPVRPRALVQAHAATPADVARHDLRDPRHLETPSDGYPWLGAIVPVPGVHDVVTFGDLLVLVGLADVAREVARRRSPLPAVDEDDEDDLLDPPPGDDGAQPAATTQASVDHDWGAAPSGDAESGSQCSAKPVTTAADTMEFWRDAALAPSPAHLAAHHDR